jgi:hypothetical protein
VSFGERKEGTVVMRKTATNPTEFPSEREFRAFRKRLLTGGLILCIIGVPAGLVLKLPYVWILAIVGIIVASVKLSTLKKSVGR